MKPRTSHLSFYKGSKIRVIMRDGRMIITKFIEKISHRCLRTTDGDINIKDIRVANYYKPHPHEI